MTIDWQVLVVALVAVFLRIVIMRIDQDVIQGSDQ